MCECLYAWSISFSLSVDSYRCVALQFRSMLLCISRTNLKMISLTRFVLFHWRSRSLFLSLPVSFSHAFMLPYCGCWCWCCRCSTSWSLFVYSFSLRKKQSVLVAVWVRSRYQTIYLSKHIHTQTYMRIHTTTATHLFVCVCFSFSFSNSRIFRCVQIRCVVLQTISEHIFTAKKAKYQNSTHIHTRALIHTQWKQSKRV